MKRRLIWLALIGLCLFALLALLTFLWTRAPASTPLPNPNGWDDFLAAGQLLAPGSDFYAATNLDQLQAVLSANTESLRLVRLGLTRECRVPTDRFAVNIGSIMQPLASMKALAQMLDANHRLALLEGRTNDAIASCVDTIKFGSEISRGGFMINWLVGKACEAIGYGPLARLAPELTSEQSRKLIPELESIEARQVPWAEAWRNEKTCIWQSIRQNPNPLTVVPGLWNLRDSVKGAEARDQKTRAKLRLLTAELALRRFQQEKGRLPARLEELLPEYLKWVPQDPFSRQPLVYRPQGGTHWLLYSVGLDGVDNGGVRKVSKGSDPPGTDIFYDSPW